MMHVHFLFRVWNFKDLQSKPWRTLAHPTYVYCGRFHPSVKDILVTAGYDKMIRVWNLEKKHGTVIVTVLF
jgi:WD40 repeat protein